MHITSYFKENWMNKKVQIINEDHPHFKEKGEIVSIDRTSVGYGVKIDLENGESCYIFDASEVKKVI